MNKLEIGYPRTCDKPLRLTMLGGDGTRSLNYKVN